MALRGLWPGRVGGEEEITGGEWGDASVFAPGGRFESFPASAPGRGIDSRSANTFSGLFTHSGAGES